MTSIILQGLKAIITANFYVSVLVLVVGSGFCISPTYSYFEFNEELFGEMSNNLRLIMLYLGITELIVCAYCFLTQRIQFFIPVGFFLILMIGSIKFYGEVNNVEVDENFPLFFLYTGISHVVFGSLAEIKQRINTPNKQ
ncbi:MAG: hypothetical protein Q8N35_04245 [Methylococcaceae bacterium]|jgi:hypothetical protein|nr:hypothetical protein [Methylococcaceae bacterium]MDZ4218606.1 hypothetical protein [Methylobacter sp.]MDP2391983.1 hypothetical protein [Methylococcaceae bacterium]MDP3018776.1 hypothetical protein [Methylococcaceae bacterium]MDP3391866.1 hypothetical protein [Methylococcaceae bacterium]